MMQKMKKYEKVQAGSDEWTLYKQCTCKTFHG